METVVVEEDTGRGVDIGVGVLGLAVLLENLGGNAAVLLDKLEDGILGDLRSSSRVVHEGFETGVRLAENGVTVAGNDTAGVEGGPQVVVDICLGVVVGNSVLHLEDPAENFLGSKTINGELVHVI